MLQIIGISAALAGENSTGRRASPERVASKAGSGKRENGSRTLFFSPIFTIIKPGTEVVCCGLRKLQTITGAWLLYPAHETSG
jgi:hypothetical protein